jgi:hypothetical protein
MDDAQLPMLVELPAPIVVEDRLKTRLTSHSLTFADGKLRPSSSIIPSRQSLAELTREFDVACRPADFDTIKAWLTVLWMSTKKSAAMSDFRLDNVLSLYASKLQRYPADMVEAVLAEWSSTPKPKDAHHWWPAIGEIEDAIRGPSETRRMIRDGLREWDMDQAKRQRLSQLYRELAVLEGGDFTFNIRDLMHADREAQIRGIRDEAARVRREIYQIEGPNTLSKAAGE